MTMIDKLEKNQNLSDSEFLELLGTDQYDQTLFSRADKVRRRNYGDAVYIRGLIEFTNYCKNDCF